MANKLKIFQSGTWNGQEFSNEQVENIFGKVTNADAIYMHSSTWVGEGIDPLSLGEFSNFEIIEENGIKEVYATPNYNEKGTGYKEDGSFKGVSVEFNEDSTELLRIALLSLNQTPAVDGAGQVMEFALREFEEDEDKISKIKTLIKELDITLLTDAQIWGLQDLLWALGDEQYAVEQLVKKGYYVTKEMAKINEFEGMTQEQIINKVAERTLKEFELKQTKKDEAKKWISDNNLRITPAMVTAGLTVEFAEKLSTSKGEFASDINSSFKKIVEALPKLNIKGLNLREFEEKEETPFEKAKRVAGN